MDPKLPTPNFDCDLEWKWPWSKLRLPPEALFTTLHERFNIRQAPIQDPYAFLQDVRDCADYSANQEEFYTQLSERRDKRVCELNHAWFDVACLLSSPTVWDCPRCGERERDNDSENDCTTDRWGGFCDLSRTMSFDSMVRFFDGYSRDRRKAHTERLLRRRRYSRERRSQKLVEQGRSRDAGDAPSVNASTGREGKDDEDAEGRRPPNPEPALPISPQSTEDDDKTKRRDPSRETRAKSPPWLFYISGDDPTWKPLTRPSAPQATAQRPSPESMEQGAATDRKQKRNRSGADAEEQLQKQEEGSAGCGHTERENKRRRLSGEEKGSAAQGEVEDERATGGVLAAREKEGEPEAPAQPTSSDSNLSKSSSKSSSSSSHALKTGGDIGLPSQPDLLPPVSHPQSGVDWPDGGEAGNHARDSSNHSGEGPSQKDLSEMWDPFVSQICYN